MLNIVNVGNKKEIAKFKEEITERTLIKEEIIEQYLDSLIAHIRYVQEAGSDIGVSPNQLLRHDQSKFTDSEFPFYAKHFFGGGEPDGFAYAWLHHMNYNPHHWQHWIFPDNFTPKGSDVENGVVEMPEVYALEMIADWMGASKAYTGSWDMADWLHNHMPRIRVHSKTAEFLRSNLDFLGYADIVHTHKWAQELGLGDV